MSGQQQDPITIRALRRVGTRLREKYTIVRLIGVGGMGAVYAAQHRNGHRVAIKVLHERLSSDPELERLFRREAQIANRIDHPGIVPVLDDDVTEDGCVFLVMPLLLGETFRARWERQSRRIGVSECVAIALRVLAVLGASHRAKIVHRDVKPENVFITESGDVRVLDFGVARFFETELPSATRSGRAVGTPFFMAPEQALGRTRDIDGRTDLWAVGATLFSALSGRFVHEGETASEVLVRAATIKAPLLAEVAPALPAPIAAVIDRALSFERDARWPDADTMATALAAAHVAMYSAPPPEVVPAPLQRSADDRLFAVGIQQPEALHPPPSHATRADGQFRSATTRTTTAAVSRREIVAPSVAPLTRPLPWLRIGVALALVIAASLAGLTRPHALSDFASAQQAHGGAPATSATDLSKLDNDSVDPVARSKFEAALQLWHDASSKEAAHELESATQLAPDFAAAHLWYVIAVNYVDGRVREHYANASLHRSSLTDAQQRVLEAFAPSVGDPPDFSKTLTQLTEVGSRYHDSDTLDLIRAGLYAKLGDIQHGYNIVERLLSRPRPPTRARYLQALLVADSDPATFREALGQCATSSPSATDCLYELYIADANDGHCDTLESICRQAIARAPSASFPYVCLGDALFARGESWDAIRAALHEQEARVSSANAPRVRAENDFRVAVARGQLVLAESHSDKWQESVAAYGDAGFSASSAYLARIALDVELRRPEAALQLARTFAAAARSWSRGDFVDADASVIYARSLVGDMDVAERDRRREPLLLRSGDRSYGPIARWWYNAYALTSWTPHEAEVAIANLPAGGIFGRRGRDAADDYVYGRVFELAGDRERATEFYRRSAASCRIRDDGYRTWSRFALARLTETNAADACKLYASVISHWKDTPESLTVREAELRAQSLRCPK